MTRLGKFLLINMHYVPEFVYKWFHGYFTRNLMTLVLGIQYPYLKLKAIPTKGLRLPAELQVVGYSSRKVYYIEENMLCGVDWKYVELPTMETYYATLLLVKDWVKTEEYHNTMHLLSWLNEEFPFKKLQVKERNGSRIFEPSVGFVKNQDFAKNMLGMQANIFMFVFPSFSYSHAYLPKDIEMLVDKVPS